MALRWVYLFQMAQYQRRKGMVDDEYWEAWDTAWIEFICTNVGIREAYELNVSACTQPFRSYTESCRTRYKGETASLLAGGRTESKLLEEDSA